MMLFYLSLAYLKFSSESQCLGCFFVILIQLRWCRRRVTNIWIKHLLPHTVSEAQKKKWYSGKSDGFNWILSCGGNGQDSVWYAQYLAKRVCDFYRAPRGCSRGLRIFVCEIPLAFKNFDTEYFDNATGWFNFFSMLVDIKSFATIVYNFIDVPDFLLFFVFSFLLFQLKSPLVYFFIGRDSKAQAPVPGKTYSWREQGYSPCSATCLGGVEELIINCVRDDTGKVASPFLCPQDTKPEPRSRPCNDHQCPPRWNYSEYSACSKSCGIGIRTREVQCIHEVARGPENIMIVPNNMCPQPPPSDRQYCNVLDCPVRWEVSEWSKCSK